MHRGGGLGEGTDDLGPRRARRGRHRREAEDTTEARRTPAAPAEPERYDRGTDRYDRQPERTREQQPERPLDRTRETPPDRPRDFPRDLPHDRTARDLPLGRPQDLPLDRPRDLPLGQARDLPLGRPQDLPLERPSDPARDRSSSDPARDRTFDVPRDRTFDLPRDRTLDLDPTFGVDRAGGPDRPADPAPGRAGRRRKDRRANRADRAERADRTDQADRLRAGSGNGGRVGVTYKYFGAPDGATAARVPISMRPEELGGDELGMNGMFTKIKPETMAAMVLTGIEGVPLHKVPPLELVVLHPDYAVVKLPMTVVDPLRGIGEEAVGAAAFIWSTVPDRGGPRDAFNVYQLLHEWQDFSHRLHEAGHQAYCLVWP